MPRRKINPLTEKFLKKQELTKEERKALGVGDWKVNAVRCKKCGQRVESRYEKQVSFCRCGAVGIYGGSWELKRLANPKDYIECSKKYADA
jgi:hypothetical protein